MAASKPSKREPRTPLRVVDPSSAAPLAWWVLVLPIGLVAALSLRKIHLFTADLGRHLANGRAVFSSPEVMTRNFYSYTHPDFPFVNHHWGSGVLFHWVHELAGFAGLSVLQMLLTVAAFCCMALVVRRVASLVPAALAIALTLPLVVSRTEVRPEAFSYLLVTVYYGVLWHWRRGHLGFGWLWSLALGMCVWANLHIYFFMGFLLFGVFAADQLLSAWRAAGFPLQLARRLALVAGAMLAAAMVNPLGWRIVAYPLRIFDNYGYMIAENQSISFFWRHPMRITEFASYHAAAAVLLVGLGFLLWFRRRSMIAAPLVMAALGGLLGFLAIRNFSLFGLLALPALAEIFESFRGTRPGKTLAAGAVLALALSLPSYAERVLPVARMSFGAGLLPGTEGAGRFFREQGLKGPILNNYDIGGYLIFHLFPTERVFVDNRPEAYPNSFFEQVYVPLQEDDGVFARQLDTYGFNTIFFYRLDNTPAGQKFLVSRIQDDAWVPVYVDDYTLIMVRNVPANADVIARFALPKSMFRVGP